MVDEVQFISNACQTEDISAYLDGELSPSRELELEVHFTVCEPCFFELNLQKQFLCSLNSSLQDENEIELPAEFTRHIVANAESTVAGLRRPRERYNAIFICIGLFVFVLFALGADAGRLFAGLASTFEQAAAVGGFFGHLIYSFFVGVAIVLRTLGAQVKADAAVGIVLAGVAAFTVMLLSRKLLRLRRA